MVEGKSPSVQKELSFNDSDRSARSPSAADVDAITQMLLADLLSDPMLAGLAAKGTGGASRALPSDGSAALFGASLDNGASAAGAGAGVGGFTEVVTPLSEHLAQPATAAAAAAAPPPPPALSPATTAAASTATPVPLLASVLDGVHSGGTGSPPRTLPPPVSKGGIDSAARSPRSPELTTTLDERWVHAPISEVKQDRAFSSARVGDHLERVHPPTIPLDEGADEPVRALHPPGGLPLPDAAAGGPPHNTIHSLSLPEHEADGERTAQTDEVSVLAFANKVVTLFITLGCSKRALPLLWEEHGDAMTAPGVHKDQRMHNHLVFDCVNEILEEQYKYEVTGDPTLDAEVANRPAWMKPDKDFSRYRRQPSASEVGEIVAAKLTTYGSFQELSERAIIEAVLAWQISEGEAQAQWTDYDQDEIVVCMKAADLLTADMMDEAVESMAVAHAASLKSRGGGGGGRRESGGRV